MQSPWETYHKTVYKIFEKDPEVTVDAVITYNDDGYSFMIASPNGDKLDAISNLLGHTVLFGNVTLTIKYGYENLKSSGDVWEKAFDGNPYFVRTENMPWPGGQRQFAIFSRDILTFFNDDLSDYCGNTHMLVADAVKNIVAKDKDITICTKSPDDP